MKRTPDEIIEYAKRRLEETAARLRQLADESEKNPPAKHITIAALENRLAIYAAAAQGLKVFSAVEIEAMRVKLLDALALDSVQQIGASGG